MKNPVVVTEFYDGQGLGNQLWAYSVTRAVAIRTQRDFGIVSFDRFKGRAFMSLDPGVKLPSTRHTVPTPERPNGIEHYFQERKKFHPSSGADITKYDSSIFDIEGSVKIDGNFESERYLTGLKPQVSQWFQSRTIHEAPQDVCLISFRGGEYAGVPELMLPRSYYHLAMEVVRDLGEATRFVVVTDDSTLAREYFPDLEIVSHRKWGKPQGLGRLAAWTWSYGVGRDFGLLQGAPALIVSNSSFSWWGAWTNMQSPLVVAPKYWARYNVSDGYWSPGSIHTEGWLWLNRDGSVADEPPSLEPPREASI